MTETKDGPLGYRLAHTMIRVTDLERSIAFYTEMLGMQVLRRAEYPEGRFTNTFVGYGPEDSHPAIELTHNWDQSDAYDKGDGWGHLALEVPVIYEACDKLRQAGIKITREPGPMKHGNRIIAFIEDPDGYKFELIEPLT
jgi:lactoylglutathione lyase